MSVVEILTVTWDQTLVTYWSSTQPSIEKLVHPVEDITLTCGRVEFCADATPTRSSWTSNNYIVRGTEVNMLQSVQYPTHLTHTILSQPFRIKCERYIFSKEVCSFVIVDFVSVFIRIRIVVSRLYNILAKAFYFSQSINNKYRVSPYTCDPCEW